MQPDSLRQLIDHTLEMGLIDAHSIDQDGSNVIVVGEAIRYLTDEEAKRYLQQMIRTRCSAGFGSRERRNRS